MFGMGYQELLVVLGIVLLLFGPKNLPKLANSIGRAVRDFKSGLSGVDRELQEGLKDEPLETKPEPPPRIESSKPAAIEAQQVSRDEKTD